VSLRFVLRCVLAIGFLSIISTVCLALDGATAIVPPPEPAYRLHFFHTHTRQRLDVVYRHGDTYDAQALAEINGFLGDHRTHDVLAYDPRVMDLLHDLTVALGRPDAEIDVICGYRTPSSNEYLRSHGHGVAQHSLHMQAMAIDIRIPGVRTADLRDAALALHRGGVGYYAGSDFVHVDVGRVRRW
jgi:uncharacterized protein YcbK (DUF882 family)